MLTFTRIKNHKFDGWIVGIPAGEYLHDGSLSALVDYAAKLGHLNPGDSYRIINNYYGADWSQTQMRQRVYGGFIILNKSIPNPIFK